jgi:hypothetical protein
MTKHGIVVGDFHSGHLVGLTPPPWRIKPTKGTRTKRNKWYDISTGLWNLFQKELNTLPPLDFVFSMGDLIEGKGTKSGGVELVTSDMEEQCAMAISAFTSIKLKCKKGVKIVGVYGTDYHTSTGGDDWENHIAESVGFSKIGAHEWVEVNGCVFDLKHHLGSSSVPYGRFTQIAKENIWNVLWMDRDLQARANVVLRAHVHYYGFCGGSDWTGITCPALQGMGSRYGARRCSGTVDWGFLHVWVDDKGRCDWDPRVVTLKTQKAQVLEV